MVNEKRAADLQKGDLIHRGPYRGEVDEIHDHGTRIGDGKTRWLTFRVRELSQLGGQLPYTTTMGPLRADDLVPVEREASS